MAKLFLEIIKIIFNILVIIGFILLLVNIFRS